jgi:hypothetical protein
MTKEGGISIKKVPGYKGVAKCPKCLGFFMVEVSKQTGMHIKKCLEPVGE